MRNISTLIAGTLLTVAAGLSASAQKMTTTGTGNGGSPHVASEWTAGGANITLSYGRPFLKGRAESMMMPAGKPWRAGADEASVLTTNKPLKFGSLSLAPGSYTLNTQPGAKAWELIVGKLGEPKQWGVPYQPALEMGRAPMTLAKTKAPVEQVTYSIDKSATGGTLRIEWGTASASVPFTVGK